MAYDKRHTQTNPLALLAQDGKIWVPIAKGAYMLASEQVSKTIRKQWWNSGEKERKINESKLLCLGHNHIDNYLAKHIASFTYTKPPPSLLETHLE